MLRPGAWNNFHAPGETSLLVIFLLVVVLVLVLDPFFLGESGIEDEDEDEEEGRAGERGDRIQPKITKKMLTQLSTIKARLAIITTDFDDLLTNAIKTVSARFDHECNRTFARSLNALEEFNGEEIEIRTACYPIESVSKFELKSNETESWREQIGVEHLIRRGCVISLTQALGNYREQGRVTYTGGYVLPGTSPDVGQTPLPDDLEQAAVEQVAFWFRNRDKLGLVRSWPHGGTYESFAQLDLLLDVKAVLRKYERWNV